MARYLVEETNGSVATNKTRNKSALGFVLERFLLRSFAHARACIIPLSVPTIHYYRPVVRFLQIAATVRIGIRMDLVLRAHLRRWNEIDRRAVLFGSATSLRNGIRGAYHVGRMNVDRGESALFSEPGARAGSRQTLEIGTWNRSRSAAGLFEQAPTTETMIISSLLSL